MRRRKGCINKKNLRAGREVYSLIVRGGLDANTFLGSHLIRLFAMCGELSEADEIFSRLPNANVFTWAAIIIAHAKLGQADQAIILYHQMQKSGVKPDEYIFAPVVKACASTGILRQGLVIHAHILESGVELDFCLCNAIIDMYIKCGSLEDARSVFDRLPGQDVVAWTALITGYTQHEYSQEALRLFQRMEEKGMEPDNIAFASILNACSGLAALDQGKQCHVHITNCRCDEDAFVGSALINMYAKCGSLRDAYRVFRKMHTQSVVTWNAIITGYALHSDYRLVLHHFEAMQQEGLKPDGVTFACLLSACSHMGLLNEGCNLFGSMQKDHCITPTSEHYTCMADLLGRAGHLIHAEDLLQTMPNRPDAVGWLALLSHCRTYGALELGRRCFDNVVIRDFKGSAGYMLMSTIFVDANMCEDSFSIQEWRICSHAWNKPGMSFIEVSNKVHDFTVGDKRHGDDIYTKLKQLTMELKKEGYMPHSDLVLEHFSDSDNEVALSGHCEEGDTAESVDFYGLKYQF